MANSIGRVYAPTRLGIHCSKPGIQEEAGAIHSVSLLVVDIAEPAFCTELHEVVRIQSDSCSQSFTPLAADRVSSE